MLIENRFEVAAPPDEVFRLMLDVERVAPCIPGAEVTGARDDGGHDARVSIRLGPVTMAYKGSVAITEQDDGARTATMAAKGSESRGQGTANATMRMAVEPSGTGSAVSVSTDLQVTGRVAQMGKGIMEDVATRMIGDMARCMEQRLSGAPEPAEAPPDAAAAAAGAGPDGASYGSATAPPPPAAAAPASGFAILGTVLAGRIRRAAPAIGGILGVVAAAAVVHRLRRKRRTLVERLSDRAPWG